MLQYSNAASITTIDVLATKGCIFGCDASWEVYASQKINLNLHRYHPKNGDSIAWKLKSIDRLQNTIFNGIWYYSKVMPTIDIKSLINDVEQKQKTQSCYKAICNIDLVNSVKISLGDTIRVEMISVIEDGFINSMQPSVGQ